MGSTQKIDEIRQEIVNFYEKDQFAWMDYLNDKERLDKEIAHAGKMILGEVSWKSGESVREQLEKVREFSMAQQKRLEELLATWEPNIIHELTKWRLLLSIDTNRQEEMCTKYRELMCEFKRMRPEWDGTDNSPMNFTELPAQKQNELYERLSLWKNQNGI